MGFILGFTRTEAERFTVVRVQEFNRASKTVGEANSPTASTVESENVQVEKKRT